MYHKLSVQHSNSYPQALSIPVLSPPTQTYFSATQHSQAKPLGFFLSMLKKCRPSWSFTLAMLRLWFSSMAVSGSEIF